MKKRLLYFIAIPLLLCLIGFLLFTAHSRRKANNGPAVIPNIGSLQLLNGCGIQGAATVVRDYLREKGFDVKKIDDAPDWNYRETLVAARTPDMTTARQIAKALHTESVVFLRDDAKLFDVTVFIGRDYRERVKRSE